MALEHAQGRPLWLDDLAVRDDLLLRLRDVADDLLGAALVDVVLDRVELVADLVEDREAVVEAVVEHLVEKAPGAPREKLFTQLLVRLAASEEVRNRMQLDVRQRDQVVVSEENVELGCVQPLDRLVVEGKVEDDEEVVGIVVDLRALALRKDVLDVQRVPSKALGECGGMALIGRLEMDPGQAA